jgi:hypothetical protein
MPILTFHNVRCLFRLGVAVKESYANLFFDMPQPRYEIIRLVVARAALISVIPEK